MTTARIAVVALFAATALAACGDDDAGGDRLSAEEWVEQAEAICQEADDDAEELFAELDDDIDAEAFGEFATEELLPRVRQQIEDIGDLNPPEELEDDVEELLDTVRRVLDEVEEQAEDDPEVLFNSDADPFEEVNELSAELGLVACAD